MSGEVCVVNIGPRQRRLRLLAGLAGLGAGAALLLVLLTLDVSRVVRLVAVPPMWAGLLGVLQYREKT